MVLENVKPFSERTRNEDTMTKTKSTLLLKLKYKEKTNNIEQEFMKMIDPTKSKVRVITKQTKNRLLLIWDTQNELNKVMNKNEPQDHFICIGQNKRKPLMII